MRKTFGKHVAPWIDLGPREAREWSAALLDLTSHTHYILAMKVSYDGQRLVSVDSDRRLIVWDCVTGAIVFSTMAGPDRRKCFDVSATNVLAFGNELGEITLCPEMKRRNHQRFRGHVVGVDTVKFSLDGQWLASIDEGGVAVLWDVLSHEGEYPRQTLQSKNSSSLIDVHPVETAFGLSSATGSMLFAAIMQDQAARPTTISLWHKPQESVWKFYREFNYDGELISPLQIENNTLAGSFRWSEGGVGVKLWSVDGKAPTATINLDDDISSCWLLSSSQCINRILTFSNRNKSLKLYDLGDIGGQTLPFKVWTSHIIGHLCFSVEGNLVAGLHFDGISVWDTCTGELVATTDIPSFRRTELTFTPTNGVLALSFGSTIRLFDYGLLCEKQQKQERSEQRKKKVYATSVSHDERWAAVEMYSHGEDRAVDIFDLQKGTTRVRSLQSRCPRSLDYDTKLIFSPGCELLALVSPTSEFGSIEIWDLRNNECENGQSHSKRTLKFSVTPNVPIAFSTNGEYIAWVARRRNAVVVADIDSTTEGIESRLEAEPQSLSASGTYVDAFCVTSNEAIDAENKASLYSLKVTKCDIGGKPVVLYHCDLHPGSRLLRSPTILRNSVRCKFLPGQEFIGFVTPHNIVCIQEAQASATRRHFRMLRFHGNQILQEYTFCDQGCCLQAPSFGNFRLLARTKQLPERIPRPCSLIPISWSPRTKWLFCGGRPFLFLPSDFENVSIRMNTVEFVTQHGPTWLRLGPFLERSVQNQPVDPCTFSIEEIDAGSN